MSSRRKRVCVLGSTGSIGEKTLQIAEDFPDRFQIVGLSAHDSAERLAEQAARFHPEAVCLSSDNPATESRANGSTRWLSGSQGLLDLIEISRPDIVVVAIVGSAGLLPTLRAIELGCTIALANKETLVTAGTLVMAEARRRGVSILPIDSEHNAIFQCLQGARAKEPLRRVIVTASGGPFRGWTRERLERATLAEALRHPTWEMGRKITIDSATLMNKGFEVIEGHHLFAIPVEKFEVVVHPQSVIHSIVEFVDGSMFAQMGVTDMYFPILNVLSHPERMENSRFEALDLPKLARLEFEDFDPEVFPCLGYAYEAVRRGGTYPAALNAANEAAVARFLDGQIGFLQIPELIDAVLQEHQSEDRVELPAVQRADAWARERVSALALSRT